MNPNVVAFVFGTVAGMRTFTAPAAFMISRFGGPWTWVVSALAAGELVGDVLPQTPSRTALLPLVGRLVSGGAVGWFVVSGAGNGPVAGGAIAGIMGALVGAYGGAAARQSGIKAIGALPAAVAEDVVAIALAAFAATR